MLVAEDEGRTPVCEAANTNNEHTYYANDSDSSESGDDGEDEEVDVVSLSRSKRKPSTTPSTSTTSSFEFPTANVAACMHNYHSTQYHTPLPSPQGQGLYTANGPVSQPSFAKKKPV